MYKHYDFYQLTNRDEQVKGISNEELVSFYFRLDSNKDIFRRRIFSIGDLMAKTGGVAKALLIVGMIIAAFFNDRLLKASIIKKIYDWKEEEFDTDPPSNSEKDKPPSEPSDSYNKSSSQLLQKKRRKGLPTRSPDRSDPSSRSKSLSSKDPKNTPKEADLSATQAEISTLKQDTSFIANKGLSVEENTHV